MQEQRVTAAEPWFAVSPERPDWRPVLILLIVTLFGFALAFMHFPAEIGCRGRMPIHVGVLCAWTCAFSQVYRRFLVLPANLLREMAWVAPVAALAELVQQFTPLHEPDWPGFSYNLLGVALAAACLRLRDRETDRS